MKLLIAAAIREGVITNYDPTSLQYHCVVCPRTGTGEILIHLKSKEHKNSLIWEAVKGTLHLEFSLSHLSDVVREAKLNNEVTTVDKSHFSYQCKICVGKKPFNGLAPLEAHLRGQPHKKEKESNKFLSTLPDKDPGVSKPPNPTYTPQPYTPQTSNTPTQASYTPAQPNYTLSQPSYTPQTSNTSLQPTYTSLQPTYTSPQPSSVLQQTAASGGHLPSRVVSDLVSSEILTPEAREAISSGIVRENEMSYFCNLCQVPLTGDAPLNQHIKGTRHKKAQKVALQHQHLPDIGALTLTPDSRMLINSPNADHPPPTTNQIDGVLPFPWTVKSCASPIPPSEKVYRNLSTPRGLVCIFNYHFSGQNTRLGARTDSHNLKTLFTRMGYRVYLYEDLTKQGTLDQLKNIQQDKDLAIYDSFILIVLSHGVKDLMFCTNGIELTEKLSLDDVRYHFVDGSCPNLRNKPKIFLANFCRGETQEESRSLQTDSITSQITNAPQDMKTIYASINNFRALRDPGRGTVFVQALCDVLANHAHDSELSDLYLELCKNMQSKAGTTPEEQNYRFKQFYFNPL
ncbi:caspase-2-like [Homarus americanus]|uniref:caspase-2-like n=1 Tax=Homarus americanus TaxID=6706 RepID=UPI001C455746|nr:caspase-2-like [Homarus americanus]